MPSYCLPHILLLLILLILYWYLIVEHRPPLVRFLFVFWDLSLLPCLSGAVALLAVPGLDALTQMAVIHSIICALGSVLVGMLLLLNHYDRTESHGRAAVCPIF